MDRSSSVARFAIALAAAAAVTAGAVPAAAAPAHHAARQACCHIPAGTPVKVELAQEISSKTQKAGDAFAIRLAAPLVVDGMVVVPAGVHGVGHVIDADGPGIGGKPAKMVLAATYLNTRHGRVSLDAMQLARPGRDESRASQAVGLAGMAFAPLSIVGIVVPGGDVVFKPGTVATAKVAHAITLPPVTRASQSEIAAASAATEASADETGPIAIPPPPAGQGQVVFFRPKSVLGTGQWFKVREAGKELGKLSNGAYFVDVTSPGLHTYTAKLEPELKDHLKIKVDPGETYFVEGTLTGGLVLGAANLSPSSRAHFDKVATKLKPAGAPGVDKPGDKEVVETAAAGEPRTTSPR